MASSASNKPQTFNPPTVPPPPPSYSQVCITPIVPTSKLITLAGLTGLSKDSTLPDTGSTTTNFVTQAKIAYQNVLNALKAAGATPRDIIHVRHYIVTKTGDGELDKKDVVERGWADQWMEFMDCEAGGHRPPDTVVGVAALATEGLLYEVEVSAIVS